MFIARAFGKSLIWLSLFSIAMGFLESSVVVYLREISYPAGFDFPLVPVTRNLGITEILREAATVIMLLAVGYLGGRSFTERFAWFLFCFAVWDIFYYLFLRLLIGWPQSLLTWDILFLIPVAWTGPVIAPVIVSLTMILLAVIILHFSGKQQAEVRIRPLEWILFITGSLFMILSFIWDYCIFVIRWVQLQDRPGRPDYGSFIYQYVPERFNWPVYVAAEIIILTGIFLIWKRYKRQYA